MVKIKLTIKDKDWDENEGVAVTCGGKEVATKKGFDAIKKGTNCMLITNRESGYVQCHVGTFIKE